MSYDFTVVANDLHKPQMCVPGTRAFFKRHKLDWRGFIRNGIPAQELVDTGDAMALRLVESARDGR